MPQQEMICRSKFAVDKRKNIQGRLTSPMRYYIYPFIYSNQCTSIYIYLSIYAPPFPPLPSPPYPVFPYLSLTPQPPPPSFLLSQVFLVGCQWWVCYLWNRAEVEKRPFFLPRPVDGLLLKGLGNDLGKVRRNGFTLKLSKVFADIFSLEAFRD